MTLPRRLHLYVLIGCVVGLVACAELGLFAGGVGVGALAAKALEKRPVTHEAPSNVYDAINPLIVIACIGVALWLFFLFRHKILAHFPRAHAASDAIVRAAIGRSRSEWAVRKTMEARKR